MRTIAEQDKNRSSHNNLISIKDVKKVYQMGKKDYLALREINLEINEGEFVSIVGKSGSGKSTLLNLMGGIDKPTEGSITIGGKEITKLKENQLNHIRRSEIGFIFQFFQLMPTLTVLENVIMPMDFFGKIPRAERIERAKRLLDKVAILSQADKFPAALSGGEQQRVAIARALANNPKIILADEPTGNLDSQTTEDVFRLLSELTLEGSSVVMVTHNDELAARCSRKIDIRDGLIIKDSKITDGEVIRI